jgi:predicted peptidase
MKITCTLLALASAATLASGPVAAEDPAPRARVFPFADRYEARVYRNAEGESLPYRLLKPRDYGATRAYPLVLFLHGSGSRGADNEAQLQVGISEWLGSDEAMATYPCFFVVPQCPRDEDSQVGSWWNPDPGRPRITDPTRLALEIVAAVQKEFSVDANRLYIAGLSMGGFGTWRVITEYPDRFAAAVSICGGGDPTQAARIAKVPVWIFHGSNDSVVPVQRSRDMYQALLRAGGHPGYTEYPGVDHESWEPALRDAQLLKWLFAQKRKG